MWNWIKRNLGITSVSHDVYIMQDDVINLSSKVYECVALLAEVQTQLDEIQKSIKEIPKEIVVKNVLDLPIKNDK